MLPPLSFVLGGAASGKSRFAENLIVNSGLPSVYLATARAWDDETKERISVHKDRRGQQWTTIEAPFDIATPLSETPDRAAVLLDCATMWLTNQMMENADMAAAQKAFVDACLACPAPLVVVSNEVGQGIVPENAMARAFREAQGRLNIALAEQADLAVQIVAGLPNVLKGQLP